MDNKIKYVDLNGLKVFAESLKQDLKNHVIELGLYQELLHRIENLELYKIVDSLPEIGDENTIYLLKNPSGSGDKNIFIEYLYNNEHGWEEIGNFTPSFDLEDYLKIEDAPFEKGDAENSAVLKGGNNQVISEGSVALGKDNFVGLKGWYYKAVQIGNNSNVVYLYLTTEQQIPILVSTANAVENQEKDININISKGDICSIINGNRLIDCFEFRLNEISNYGRISFTYKGEGTNPLSTIQNVEELKREDYSVFCISKPSCGIVDLSKCNIALGNNTKSLAESSVSIGLRSTAVGITSYAEGQDTIAVGECSHAEGYNTLATGGASHSEGSATKATGLHSHAEGDTTEASGEQSHAEGKQTIAEGEHSHSEGYWTKAHGKSSHVEGQGLNNTTYSVASGDYSHSEGFYTRAFGTGSHTEGTYTIAYNKGEHAEGIYNKSTENVTLHSVGIGTSVNDRKNAHEITNDGKHYIYGVGGYDGTNPDKATDVASELTELSAEVSGLSEKIDNLPSGESSVFEAIYGVTTYDEVVEAKNTGKFVICIKDRLTYHLSYVSEDLAYFTTIRGNVSYATYINKATNKWTDALYSLEQLANKVTTLSESSTDTQYPSAKAVYEALQNLPQGGGDSPIEKGDVENSAVLKGGNNRVISEGGVALGRGNIAGLRGFYYKHIRFVNTTLANIYLSKTQVIPTITTGGEIKDTTILPDNSFSKGDIISIVNDNKYNDIAVINNMSEGMIQIKWLSEAPFASIKKETNLSPEDYSIYCLDKPIEGISDLGKYSFANGTDNKAINTYTEVSGKGNIAKGKFGKVWGKDNIGGYNTTTFGSGNVNLADNSLVNGTNNINEGNNSVIHGNKNKNYGKRAFVVGNENITNNENEVAFGKYNDSKNDTQFSIGIGTSDTDRKNAFEVKQNGDIYIEGVEGRIQDKLNKGSSATPDWNAREGEAGYIKNRPFYSKRDIRQIDVDGEYTIVVGEFNIGDRIDISWDLTYYNDEIFRGSTSFVIQEDGEEPTYYYQENDFYIWGGKTFEMYAYSGVDSHYGKVTYIVNGEIKTLEEKYIPDTIARKSDIPVPIIINYNTIKDAANSEVNTISEQTWLKYIANDTYKNYDWIIQRDGIKYNCTVIPDYDNEHIQILYFTRNEIEGTLGPLGNAIMKYSGLRIKLLPYTENTYLIYKISNGGSLETREFVFGESYNKNAYLIAAAQMSGIDTIDCKWVYTTKADKTITVNGQDFLIENSITNVDAIFSVKDKSLTYVDGNGLINKVTFADNGSYDISKNNPDIPDTVVKTTPQILSEDDKNQVKENLGISNPNWDAREGEAGYIKNRPFYNNVDYVINKGGEYKNVHNESNVTFNNKILFNLRDIVDNDVITIISGPPVTLEKRYESDGTTTLIIEDIGNYLSTHPIIIGDLVTIPEIFIPDTIARKSDIVVDPIVWKYLCNPCVIKDGEQVPEDLLGNQDTFKYTNRGMYIVYDEGSGSTYTIEKITSTEMYLYAGGYVTIINGCWEVN